MRVKLCAFRWQASTLNEAAEANITSSPVVEEVPNGAPPTEVVQLEAGEQRVLPPNEKFSVGGRLFHFRDKWTFSPWAHSIVSKGLGWSWEPNQPPSCKVFYQKPTPLLQEYVQELLSKAVIKRVKHLKFQGRLFCVPK